MSVATSFTFPDHVPLHLRWDHSLREFAMAGDDPFVTASRLFEGPDVFYARDATQDQGAWVITRHALQSEAFVDYEHFTSQNGSGIEHLVGVPDFRLAPIDYDPPLQTAFRRAILPYLTPKAVKALDGAVRNTCTMLVDRFSDRGECEFIEEFAIPFPTYIFLSLIGMPIEEAPRFLAWEAAMLRGATIEERVVAARSVLAYLAEFLEAQRAEPATPLLAAVINADLDGRPITDSEILGTLFTFYLGGLDTVYSTLGWIFRHIALHPSLQDRLRQQPSLIDYAVDEFVRAFSVVSTSRRVAKDFAFHGVAMREGDKVLLPLFLAGRDPTAWERPDEIDLDRRPASLAFASGPHLCAGRNLARRELRIALDTFLSRFPRIRMAAGETYVYHTSPVYGVDQLHLTLR